MASSLVSIRMMQLLSKSPANRSLTQQLQRHLVTKVCDVGLRQARPVPALAAALGGGGSTGSNGGGRGGNGGGDGGQGGSHQGGSGWGRVAALTLAGGLLLCGEGAAWAASNKAAAPAHGGHPPATSVSAADELTVEKVTELLASLSGPMLTNLGFSGCAGVAAGYALKKVGQLVALCVGVAFLLIQGLAASGFITVHWSHVHSSITQALDVNKDGKVDMEDFKPLISQGLAALSQGVPSVGGFLTGFMLAIRKL